MIFSARCSDNLDSQEDYQTPPPGPSGPALGDWPFMPYAVPTAAPSTNSFKKCVHGSTQAIGAGVLFVEFTNKPVATEWDGVRLCQNGEGQQWMTVQSRICPHFSVRPIPGQNVSVDWLLLRSGTGHVDV